MQWNRHLQEEHHPPSLSEKPARPLEAASSQCYHQSQRELLLKTSSHLCISNWRQPRVRALALCYQVTVTSSHLPLKIPQISRRINEQMGWRHLSWFYLHDTTEGVRPARASSMPYSPPQWGLPQPFLRKVTGRHVDSSCSRAEQITELYLQIFTPFFFFFTLSCSHWEAQTKPGGHSSVLLITYEHSSESRMSQIQTCCHPQLCFCLDFKSNSSENCSCRSSTSGYTDNGHWAPNRCELQVTRRVRFHFNQKLTFKHAVMSSPSLKKTSPPGYQRHDWNQREEKLSSSQEWETVGTPSR